MEAFLSWAVATSKRDRAPVACPNLARRYGRRGTQLPRTPIWDRWFSIVEILPGVENAYVGHDSREPLAA